MDRKYSEDFHCVSSEHFDQQEQLPIASYLQK